MGRGGASQGKGCASGRSSYGWEGHRDGGFDYNDGGFGYDGGYGYDRGFGGNGSNGHSGGYGQGGGHGQSSGFGRAGGHWQNGGCWQNEGSGRHGADAAPARRNNLTAALWLNGGGSGQGVGYGDGEGYAHHDDYWQNGHSGHGADFGHEGYGHNGGYGRDGGPWQSAGYVHAKGFAPAGGCGHNGGPAYDVVPAYDGGFVQEAGSRRHGGVEHNGGSWHNGHYRPEGVAHDPEYDAGMTIRRLLGGVGQNSAHYVGPEGAFLHDASARRPEGSGPHNGLAVVPPPPPPPPPPPGNPIGFLGMLGKGKGGTDGQDTKEAKPTTGRTGGGGRQRDRRVPCSRKRAGTPPNLPPVTGRDICLNPADRDDTFVFLGRPLVRGRRAEDHEKWAGCRATKGITSGRGAFALKNETGGNMRIGWSLVFATLELGLDKFSFGYGGTASRSTDGKYSNYGQTYGEGDVITALIDLDRHVMTFMKNEHELPGDAFRIPRDLWGHPFFPHVHCKEATTTAYFGPGASTPSFPVPALPAGFQWLSEMQLVDSEKHCSDMDAVFVEDVDAVIAVDTSQLQQAAHRLQFEEWKVNVNNYAAHFQQPLTWEYEAEKLSVAHRVKRGARQLESTGYGCFGLSAERVEGKIRLTRPSGIPRLAEISMGRTVLLTNEEGTPDLSDPQVSISGEVDSITDDSIILSSTYDRLPPGTVFRVDLGPNVSTYDRIDRVLDMLQRCEPPTKKAKNRMGIMSPCTPLGDALYADVAATAKRAQRWDPSTRPKPNPDSHLSKAARVSHLAVLPRNPQNDVPAPQLKRLNESQQAAVDLVLAECRRMTLVQGPPGTGKTTTAIEVICSWLRCRKGPILATAFSNKGVNNLAEGLYRRGVSVLRLGACDADLPYSMEAHLAWHGFDGRKGGGKGKQLDIIGNADVVCATVIGSGMGLLKNFNFHFVVLDEAAQIIEPACLIPLSKGSVQVVMVGDQCQLPATVMSHEAQIAGLDVSLFDRLISIGMEVHMLAMQYRMHPIIAEFPSWRFYNHKLETGLRPADRPVISSLLGTMAIIHVADAENSQGMSKSNAAEAECIMYLLKQLKAIQPLNEVGVITPYSGQVSCIRQSVRSLGSEVDQVQVSSVDAFQGSEKEAILLSMVRSNLRGDIGFVADWRRLNVAATRAKRLLVVVGNVVTLSQHALWRDFFGFHQDLNIFEWTGEELGALSPRPARLIAAAREISRRRGVKPLPLRGDYPVDGDFDRVERGKLTVDAPPVADAGDDLSWDAAPEAPEVDWGGGSPQAPKPGAGDGWEAAPSAAAPPARGRGAKGSAAPAALGPGERSARLWVGPEGALLDLEATRWGMRVEGVDRRSNNCFEVGSTIVAIEGQSLEQPDNSTTSLSRVEELFGSFFGDGACVHLAPQEELLFIWDHVPKDVKRLSDDMDLVTEYVPNGLLVYGPLRGLELARSAASA